MSTSLAELNGLPLTFSYAGQRQAHRLEICWQGDSDPPWFGPQGLRQNVVDAVIRAASAVDGVSGVRENLSSSLYLRVWLQLPKNSSHKRYMARRALARAVRGALVPVR